MFCLFSVKKGHQICLYSNGIVLIGALWRSSLWARVSCPTKTTRWFHMFLFSPLPGEMIQFDWYFWDELKPPTRKLMVGTPKQHGPPPPQKWVDVSPYPFGCIFRFRVELFRGCISITCLWLWKREGKVKQVPDYSHPTQVVVGNQARSCDKPYPVGKLFITFAMNYSLVALVKQNQLGKLYLLTCCTLYGCTVERWNIPQVAQKYKQVWF